MRYYKMPTTKMSIVEMLVKTFDISHLREQLCQKTNQLCREYLNGNTTNDTLDLLFVNTYETSNKNKSCNIDNILYKHFISGLHNVNQL